MKTAEEKQATKRMYNETYYQKNKDAFKQYYVQNKERLGYGRVKPSRVGIYVLKNKKTDHVYVGASKNIGGRWKAHKVATLKQWKEIADPSDWYYEIACDLPSFLDCQAMNHFEWLLISYLQKTGVPVLNAINLSNPEKHLAAIQDMMIALSEDTNKWVSKCLEEQ